MNKRDKENDYFLVIGICVLMIFISIVMIIINTIFGVKS